MITKLEADEVEARVEKDIKLTHDLMCEFGIDPKKDGAYFKLSIILTRKLYPDGLRKVGRPKKKINNYLQYRLAKKKKRRKPGRPPTRKESNKGLLRLVEAVQVKHGLEGRGSDKKALEILIDECARDTKKSKIRLRKKYLKPWQKELSKARHP